MADKEVYVGVDLVTSIRQPHAPRQSSREVAALGKPVLEIHTPTRAFPRLQPTGLRTGGSLVPIRRLCVKQHYYCGFLCAIVATARCEHAPSITALSSLGDGS